MENKSILNEVKTSKTYQLFEMKISKQKAEKHNQKNETKFRIVIWIIRRKMGKVDMGKVFNETKSSE